MLSRFLQSALDRLYQRRQQGTIIASGLSRSRLRFEPLEERQMLTSVSGHITTNTVWNDTSEPYVLTGDLTVDVDVTLTIGPGVDVQSQRYSYDDYIYDFNVAGTVDATNASFSAYTQLKVLNGGELNMSGTMLSGGSADNEGSLVDYQGGPQER